MQVGYEKTSDFQPIPRFFSETIQNRATVTVERQQEVVCDLLNDTIFNDIE